jgi:hypothetical protein
MSRNFSRATAQRRKEKGAKLIENSSLRLCAFAGEIL